MPLTSNYPVTDELRSAFDDRSNTPFTLTEQDALLGAAVAISQTYIGYALPCIVGKEADADDFSLDELPANIKLGIVEVAVQLDYGRGDTDGKTPALNDMARSLLSTHKAVEVFPDDETEEV